jgi:hypothetical protein
MDTYSQKARRVDSRMELPATIFSAVFPVFGSTTFTSALNSKSSRINWAKKVKMKNQVGGFSPFWVRALSEKFKANKISSGTP